MIASICRRKRRADLESTVHIKERVALKVHCKRLRKYLFNIRLGNLVLFHLLYYKQFIEVNHMASKHKWYFEWGKCIIFHRSVYWDGFIKPFSNFSDSEFFKKFYCVLIFCFYIYIGYGFMKYIKSLILYLRNITFSVFF